MRRLDIHLVSEGLVASRSKAAHLIRTGSVRVNGEVVRKQSHSVKPGDVVELEPFMYVGRGGYKLQAALDAFGVECRGLRALDIGCSEGGFTDCLLRNGASSVTAVDIAEDVLNAGLREDDRVIFIGGVDATDPERLAQAVDNQTFPLVVMDVTGELLEELVESSSSRLEDDGVMIALLKPQYEQSREFVADQEGLEVLKKALTLKRGGLSVSDWTESPIRGGSKNRGNREFLLMLTH